jgi:hypothetical protein
MAMKFFEPLGLIGIAIVFVVVMILFPEWFENETD